MISTARSSLLVQCRAAAQHCFRRHAQRYPAGSGIGLITSRQNQFDATNEQTSTHENAFVGGSPSTALSERGTNDAEPKEDVDAITEVTIAAFKTLEISNQTEQFIIEALRAAHGLTLSLVADVKGRVVGHIAFSPITISDGTANWYGLGPVSVLPKYQRQGIGRALIEEGLSRLKGLQAQGCCLVGYPAYYKKFGFRSISGLLHEGVPSEVFLALSFSGHLPQGKVAFHEGFQADGPPTGETANHVP